MKRLIIPNMYADHVANHPIIFLAGPIRSAPNWQDEAIELIFSIDDHVTIISPRRGIRSSISDYMVIAGSERFKRQREWERYYLELASRTGCIMFWLPGEYDHDCKKVFGAITRMELGQSMTRYSYDNNYRFCVGSDGKFPELNTIKYDLMCDAPGKKISDTLESTCRNAIEITKV